MVDLVRRRLLGGSVAGAGLAALGLPGAALAELVPPAQQLAPAKLSDIDHIIVLMKENRSFDHYFGTLSGVRGFDDREVLTLASGRPVFHQPDSMHADGYVLPFRLDTTRTSAQRMRALFGGGLRVRSSGHASGLMLVVPRFAAGLGLVLRLKR